MKRYAFYLLIMAAAVISACNKETLKDENTVAPEVQKGTYIYTINASLPEEQPSGEVGVLKSDYDASGHFSWSTGDAISVLFHNGDDDQFFTLTRVSGTGNSATFSGPITSGYTIGASNTGKIWALYPANSNHSYTAGSNDNRPSFYTPPVIDLSGGNFSANIPMYDVLDAEGSFSFKYMTAAMKFTISNLDVSKIRVDISNGVSYGFSGLTTMSSGYLRYSSPSADQKKISFICDVTSKTAVFYLSGRYAQAAFKPTITITDYNTGYTIKEIVASTAKVLDKASDLVPSVTISAPGTGSFASKFGIDWFTDPSVQSADGDGVGYSVIKGIADESFLYVLLGVVKSRLTINENYLRANSVNWYFADRSGYFGYLYQNGIPMLNDAGSSVPDSRVTETPDIVYYELKCTRAEAKFEGKLYSTVPASIGIHFCVFYNMYKPDSESSTVEDWSHYVYSPTITVDIPAYVAP